MPIILLFSYYPLFNIPELCEGLIYYDKNPIVKILDQFPILKSEGFSLTQLLKSLNKIIFWMNEYDVIDDNGNINEYRLQDVKDLLST